MAEGFYDQVKKEYEGLPKWDQMGIKLLVLNSVFAVFLLIGFADLEDPNQNFMIALYLASIGLLGLALAGNKRIRKLFGRKT